MLLKKTRTKVVHKNVSQGFKIISEKVLKRFDFKQKNTFQKKLIFKGPYVTFNAMPFKVKLHNSY